MSGRARLALCAWAATLMSACALLPLVGQTSWILQAAFLLGAYGVVVNMPFIAIQRYNRFRTQALLARVARRRSTT